MPDRDSEQGDDKASIKSLPPELLLEIAEKRALRIALGADHLYSAAYTYAEGATPGIDFPESTHSTNLMINSRFFNYPHTHPHPGEVLVEAVQQGQIEAVRFLFEAGVSPNAYSVTGYRMLSFALQSREMVDLFFQHGVDVTLSNLGRYYDTESPLGLAVLDPVDDIVQLLISRGGNLEEPHVMQRIVDSAQMETIRMALARGPLNLISPGDESIVHCAAQRRDPDIFDYVITRPGINLDIPNALGLTPLHICLINGHDELFVRRLVECGADINAQGWDLHTPLHLALKKRSFALAKMLIERGCRLNVINRARQSELSIAIFFGVDTIIPMLLERNADINLRDEATRGPTPLHDAVRSLQCDLVKLLLDGPRRADLKIKDSADLTALELAESLNLTKIAQMLRKYR